MAADSERYIFEAEWYDKVSFTLKKFYLYFFPSDNSVELFDLKTRKTFLRRSKCNGVESKDFYVGAMVTIFSRNIKITNFADQATKKKLSSKRVKTYVILKPNIINKLGEILKTISDYDFHISNLRMGQINLEDANEIFESTSDKLITLIECIIAGPVILLVLLSEDTTVRLQKLTTTFEENSISNGIYISDNKDEINFFSSEENIKQKIKSSAKLQNCTCCIIKPHAVQAKLFGPIIIDIQKANFIISAVEQFYINSVNSEEFLEVYKGVLPDYAAMVSELQSGVCFAMEITHSDAQLDIVSEFRKFCGPMDPEMARQLRPNTLRAKYGKTRIQNAVHCSDLSDDGLLEVEYFFQILNKN
ncbi:PREDICTED: nucleoside diphosphate kinase 7, partial [Ceratosolen solmsi marchali]|uniref:Nucleoside diphosphate kinase 7 n=1 Tax=Ceratosolen solmsi marchali TaxID=326594 RepID=A0AAJ6YWB5_9HYME